ncbi:MAG: hypothetical protein IJX25_00165 [Clostridia bacterium]|nr:hypothetical protein [Clostridia bacterium]
MLKIKDNIDLKELEKLGFEKIKREYVFTNNTSLEMMCIQENRNIYFEVKSIGICGAIIEDLLYALFELIQLGYVEKVEE